MNSDISNNKYNNTARLRMNVRTTNYHYLMWFVFFIIMWYMSSMCADNDSLDLKRYYDIALAYKNASLSDIIEQESSRGVDFIYYVILYWAIKLSISLNALTAFIVTVYYVMIVGFMKAVYREKMEWYVMATVLFLTPITWNIEISRNMMAIMFLYLAVRMTYEQKWIWAVLFCVLGVFTHFSVVMYVVLIVISILIKLSRLNTRLIPIIIIAVFLVSYYIPDYVYRLMSFTLEGSDTVYSNTYLVDGSRDVLGYATWRNVGNGDKIPVLYAIFFSVTLLLMNKKQGFEFWMLMGLTVLFAFFVRSSLMFTNRCMMVMPMFWGLNVAQIYQYGSLKTRKIVCILSLVALIPISWHIISYRNTYFPFLF